MPENRDAGIHIGELNLRIPGSSAEGGHRLANSVSSRLAEEVPADGHRDLGAMTIRVRLAAGASEAETSDAVADALRKALR
ncbi:MAG: hypothetical protein ABIZ80_12040, partial [Bryobacteraceae bacterium]